MHDLIAIFLGFILGSVTGMIVLARWWMKQIRKPDIALQMLKDLHQASHHHWLQRSLTDSTRVCPCCGWSEPKTVPNEIEKPTVMIQDQGKPDG